jgi:rubredoxin
MKCEKCGWELIYIPRSFQEQIKEIIREQRRTGYWMCPDCGIKKLDDKR